MSEIYYFFPRCGGIGLLDGVGLRDRFPLAPAQSEVGPEIGPDGLSGIVFHRGLTPRLPAPIEWHAASSGEYWLGWHAHRRPRQNDLARSCGFDMLAETVRCLDGNDWEIPIVLPMDAGPCGLPYSWAADPNDPDGAFIRAVDPRYNSILEMARRYLAIMEGKANDSITPGETWRYVCGLLSVRYCVGPEEIGALQIVNDAVAVAIIAASIESGKRFPGVVFDLKAAEEILRIRGAA